MATAIRNGTTGGWKDWVRLFAVLLPVATAVMTPVYLSLGSIDNRMEKVETSVATMNETTTEIRIRTESVDRLYKVEVENLRSLIVGLQARIEVLEDRSWNQPE
jgi:hypothetical protein